MNLDFLCLTKRDLENQRFDSSCSNGAGSSDFYLAQTCHPRVWYTGADPACYDNWGLYTHTCACAGSSPQIGGAVRVYTCST